MKKRLLKITGVIVLSITLLGLWGYNKYLKPNPEVAQQLNDQFGEGFFNSFEDETVQNNSVGNPESQIGSNASQRDNVTSGKDGIISTSVKSGSVTQDEISQEYSAQLNHLQAVAMGRLDILYSTAKQEYTQAKKAGTLNRSALIEKYLQAGTTLEANVDNQFYSTLNLMEEELKVNNLPTDIVSVYINDYEKVKADKRAQFLSK